MARFYGGFFEAPCTKKVQRSNKTQLKNTKMSHDFLKKVKILQREEIVFRIGDAV